MNTQCSHLKNHYDYDCDYTYYEQNKYENYEDYIIRKTYIPIITVDDNEWFLFTANVEKLKLIKKQKNNECLKEIIIDNGLKSLGDNKECSICLDELNQNNSNNIRANLDDYFITKCGHTFHKKCLAKTIIMSQSLKCPICRTELKIIND